MKMIVDGKMTVMQVDSGEKVYRETFDRTGLVKLNQSFELLSFDCSIIGNADGKLELDEMTSLGCKITMPHQEGFVFELDQGDYQKFKTWVKGRLKETRWYP